MTFEQLKKELSGGAYICWTDTDRPTLYNEQHQKICGVPLATAERIAAEKSNHFVKWSEEWSGHYVARYLGKKYQQHSNDHHCKSIAENVNAYATGAVWRCPECGHTFTAPEDCEIYRCSECGNVSDLLDYESCSMFDYLEDCLDIEYRCDSRREYRSVQIMIACGGPNIYLDTASCKVELYWWGDRADYPLSREAVAALDEWAEEYWNC